MPDAPVVPLSDAASGEPLESLRAALRAGGVFAIPTDTFYGLAADPLSEPGVGRVYALKGRSGAQALPVVIASSAQLATLGVIAGTLPLGLGRTLGRLPGANDGVVCVDETAAKGMTARRLVPTGHSLLIVSGTVGSLVERFLATYPDRTQVHLCGLDFVVDAGPSENVVPSTIVDLTKSPPEILRSGAFPWS